MSARRDRTSSRRRPRRATVSRPSRPGRAPRRSDDALARQANHALLRALSRFTLFGL